MVAALLFSLSVAQSAALPDEVLSGVGGYCVATGYCTSRPGDSGRPAGPMYLAFGLVGVGLAALRRERQA